MPKIHLQQLRQKVCFGVMLLCVLAGLYLLFSLLCGYSHNVPLILGPIRLTALIGLGMLFLLALDLRLSGFSLEKMIAWLLFAAGVGFFTACLLLGFYQPESTLLAFLTRNNPLGLLLLASGVGVWLSSFLPASCRQTPRRGLVLGLIFVGLSLLPILSSGFCWDDAFFSARIPAMRISGASIFERTWDEILIYGRMGRINPFATFQFILFYLLPNAFAYKLYFVLLTLLGCWLFYKVLWHWTRNQTLGLCVLLLLPLCIQLRLYHDPMTGYYGLMQMMFCELMASLLFFLKYLKSNKGSHLILSLTFFSIGLMSYEMFYPFILFFPLLACFHERSLWRGIKRCLPFISIEILLLAASMTLRLTYVSDEAAYNGTAFGLDISAILKTWGNQISGAFPLSYQFLTDAVALAKKLIPREEMFASSLSEFLKAISLPDLLALGIVVYTSLSLPRSSLSPHEESDKPTCLRHEVDAGECGEKPAIPLLFQLCLFSLLLIILPGMTIAVSQKYQQQLKPGLAYLPVYFEYFGAALLLVTIFIGLYYLLKSVRARRILCGTGGGLFLVILLINAQNNRRSVELLNQTFLYPRQTAEAALQAGILGELNAETDVLISNNSYYLWEHGWMREPFQQDFYSLNARKPVNATGVREFALSVTEWESDETVYPLNTSLIEYNGTKDRGFARFGRLTETKFNFDRITLDQPMALEVFYFIRGDDEGLPQVLSYRTRDGMTHQFPAQDAKKINTTDEGTLYKLEEEKAIYFDSIGLVTYQ